MSDKRFFIILAAFSALTFVLAGCGNSGDGGDTQAKAQSHSTHDGHDHSGHDHASHEGHDHGEELVEQTTCPVMGGAIDKKLYVEKNGKRIYMCCEGCREKIENDFEKYEAKLKELGQKPEKI